LPLAERAGSDIADQIAPASLCSRSVRSSRAISGALVGSWHEHELSLRRRALEQLVRAARISERQPLGHDRVKLALTQQLEQHTEVLAEPPRVAGASAHR